MPSGPFSISEHKVPCQYIREYPHATAHSQESALYLAVKRYKPTAKPQSQSRGVTIIAATANGMPKEVYEPLWEDLLNTCVLAGVAIKSIWIADMAQQGDSAVLNEQELGNDPNWFDHSRDLLHMMNIFRNDMPRPIIGIGHSLGAAQMVFLANMHPRLFSGVVLIDPIIVSGAFKSGAMIAKAATFRRDLWPSHAEAEKAVRKNLFFNKWDPRVVSRLAKCSFRQTPTLLHPGNEAGPVTLKTPKHQEAFTAYRPNWLDIGVENEASADERRTHPDIDPAGVVKSPFYRPEARIAQYTLSALRPPALFVFGSESEGSQPKQRKEKMAITGTGLGGSGGARCGLVHEEVLSCGHFVPMEDVPGTAKAITRWLKPTIQRWDRNENFLDDEWKSLSKTAKQSMNKQWLNEMRKWNGGPRPKQTKL
jgi:pimeloyl-ACP methyl ester carboxylesterase